MSRFEIPWIEIGEIYHYFGYKNRRAAIRAIRVGTFPLATYELAGRQVVDKEVARAFFVLKREEGLKPFNLKLAEG